ncbi:hypothetical protein ADUPG1_003708, partial [Aduncisulcus paluster]
MALVEVPETNEEKRILIKKFHGEGMEDHGGISATLKKLRAKGYLWKGITKMVKEVVGQCPTCQKLRKKKVAPYPVLSTRQKLTFEIVAIDAIGPYKKDGEGH